MSKKWKEEITMRGPRKFRHRLSSQTAWNSVFLLGVSRVWMIQVVLNDVYYPITTKRL